MVSRGHSARRTRRKKIRKREMLTIEQLTDATNYDFTATGSGFEWVENGHSLGVTVSQLPGGDVVIMNGEYDAGVVVPEDRFLAVAKIAVDYVQFIEYARHGEYTFMELASALEAMGCDYGFIGSGGDLGISLEYGAWLEITDGRYLIWDADGFEYYAATPEGCARAWQRCLNTMKQVAWANQQREKANA